MKKLIIPAIIFLCFSCSTEKYYSAEDFGKVDKIDSHVHLYTDRNFYLECAAEDGFRLLTITDDHENIFSYVQKNYDFARKQYENNKGKVQFATTFTMEGWDEPGWTEKTKAWVLQGIGEGAVAVKIWKNIGMAFKDRQGKLIMADDPGFDAVFAMLAERKIPVIGHLGEPRNCWLPLEEMTTNGNRNYFKNNPQYHMYLHPEFPSYEDQIAARDNLLRKNPDLRYIGAHLGSQEWSVDELSRSFDSFPNMAVDLSARMDHLFIQTSQDREKVRNFFIRYQDRLIYGTDTGDRGSGEKEQLCKRMHDKWYQDWCYFVSETEMKVEDKNFNGLKLPKEIVDKIYRGNYMKWIHPF